MIHPHITLLFAFSFLTALVSSGFAADEESDEKEKTLRAPSLHWWNGESVTGELIDATDKIVQWKSPIFDEALSLELKQIRQVRYHQTQAEPTASMVVSLHDGSRIFGDLTAITPESITLDCPQHGTISIAKNSIALIRRISGAGILYNGPFGDRGWKKPGSTDSNDTKESLNARHWQADPTGTLATVGIRQKTTLQQNIIAPVEITLHLSATNQPDFSFEILCSTGNQSITTWENDLVLYDGTHTTHLLTFEKDQTDLKIRLHWHPKTGITAHSDATGKRLENWQFSLPEPEDSEKKPKKSKLKGFTLTNSGPDLTLETLRIRKLSQSQSKTSPLKLSATQPKIEFIDGRIASGNLKTSSSGTLSFQSSTPDTPSEPIAFDDLLAIHFPTPTEDAEQAPETPPFELSFSDTTRLVGELQSISKEEILLQTAFSDTPISSHFSQLETLNHLTPPPEEDPPILTDQLSIPGTSLSGRWHPAQKKSLQFSPTGATAPVALASTSSAQLTRSTPEETWWRLTPALVHLNDGQIIPGKITSIQPDEKGVTLESPLFGTLSIPPQNLRALQFPREEIPLSGFEDPAWEAIQGKPSQKTLRELNKGTLELATGTSWGHPSLLSASSLEFDFISESSGAISLHLFGDGREISAPSTHLILAYWGNQVYSGLGDGGQNFESNYKQTGITQGEPAIIRIEWTFSSTLVFINEQQVHKIPNKTLKKKDNANDSSAKRSGLGTIISPVGLWGNNIRPSKISNLIVDHEPGIGWIPSIQASARKEALFLPRFRKNDPPNHLLVAHNGDLLRGTIEKASATELTFRTGLETYQIPNERAAAAVWLNLPEVEEKEPTPSAEASHWIVLRTGARIALDVDSFGPKQISGKSPGLGEASIPIRLIHSIQDTSPKPSPATLALSDWKFTHAPEPAPSDATGAESDSPLLAEPAPDFSLPILGEEKKDPYTIEDQEGKVVVLDFWATWCGPCVQSMPALQFALSEFETEDVEFIAINQAESSAVVSQFLKARKWNEWEGFRVLLDSDQAVARKYEVTGIPHTVVIDREGKVASVKTGFSQTSAAEINALVKTLLEAPKPEKEAPKKEAKPTKGASNPFG